MRSTLCFYEARDWNPDAWQLEAQAAELGIESFDLIYASAGAHFLHRGGIGTNYFAWPGNNGERGRPLDSYVHHAERMKAFILRIANSKLTNNLVLAEMNAGCDEDWTPPRR